jgi:glycogen debranching enzyme
MSSTKRKASRLVVRRIAAALLFSAAVYAAGLEISRPVRSWEFVDATGEKASLLGAEDGTLEAFVYPLKIFKDLRLTFVVDGRVIPAATASRSITVTPGAYAITYTGDEFEVREILVAPVHEAGALIRLEINAYEPLRIDAEFTRDFQLMWPASIGSAYQNWSERQHGFLFGADGYPYAAFFGSPSAQLLSHEYETDYHSTRTTRFTLGTVKGKAERVLAVAASMTSKQAALETYDRLTARPGEIERDTEAFYRAYLAKGVQLDLPDAELQASYDWSRISMRKGMVDNPFLGQGLVAGYGPSKGVYRPGYAWFFGRDSFWTSFALNSAGDFESARAAIAFIAGFQRSDGKIPHEISQSASLVDWFKQFPYGYASADATPLFVIAAEDYVNASGDTAFARELWPRLARALSFMRSTLDEDGFPKNYGVGHGWVEGGPLLPVRVELYQAGCYVRSLRALAKLAALTGHDDLAAQLEQPYKAARAKIEEKFWLPDAGEYAFATGMDGKPVRQPSVLSTVPMWFDVLDERHAQSMVEHLSGEDHASDWGMRIISSASPEYGPAGYHFGSVWPLFTGWASVGEYREHQPAQALGNLRANAWLALDGAGGNTTEVLSGATYSPLSTASPHQIWSAAMVVSPLIRGLLGLEVDTATRAVALAPHLPAGWRHLGIRNVAIGSIAADFQIDDDGASFVLLVKNRGKTPFGLDFAPALAPGAQIVRAEWNGARADYRAAKHSSDWHPVFKLPVSPGENTLKLSVKDSFGFVVPFTPPRLGEPSSALKVISEHWNADGSELDLKVAGLAGHTYSVDVYRSAHREPIPVSIPSGSGAYVPVMLHIRTGS